MVLEEAMEAQTGLIHETGDVNEFLIENPGELNLFIQAGDIVKGGRQDRTLGAESVLFRKVWKKLLRAAALEAIAERNLPASELPFDVAEVSQWLDEAETAAAEEENLPPRTRLATRRTKSQLRFERQDTNVAHPIHLSILAQ